MLDQVRVGSADYVLLRRFQARKTRLDSLTQRERDAVRHACMGASNKEIAHQMSISLSTVRVLLWRACRKVGVSNRDDLVRLLSSAASLEDSLRS